MTESKNLAALIAELESADSALERLRRLALAWRTVRQLGREERSELALRLGLEGAEDVVEKLARRKGGLAPTKLLEAVHAARRADPSQLKELIGGLRDPERRRDLLEQGLRAVEDRLVEPEDLGAELFEAIGGQPEAEVAEAEAVEEEPLPAPEPPAPEPPSPPPTPPVAEAAVPEADPFPLQAAPAEVAQAPPRAPTATPEPAEGVSRPAASQPLAAPEEPLPSLSSDEALASASEEGPLLARLRAVHEAASRLVPADAEDIRRILAGFPAGWARRRVLNALLRAGAPDSFADAIELVAELEQERDRMWCLATLVAARDVSDDELEVAVELLGFPAHRRRLEHRRRRG